MTRNEPLWPSYIGNHLMDDSAQSAIELCQKAFNDWYATQPKERLEEDKVWHLIKEHFDSYTLTVKLDGSSRLEVKADPQISDLAKAICQAFSPPAGYVKRPDRKKFGEHINAFLSDRDELDVKFNISEFIDYVLKFLDKEPNDQK